MHRCLPCLLVVARSGSTLEVSNGPNVSQILYDTNFMKIFQPIPEVKAHTRLFDGHMLTFDKLLPNANFSQIMTSVSGELLRTNKSTGRHVGSYLLFNARI